MSYRVRFTMPDGRTGHWMRDYATCGDAQKAIDERMKIPGLVYTVEEVPDAPEPMTTTTYQIRCTGPSGSTFLFRDVYATRCLAELIRDSVERWSGGCYKYTVEEIHDASGHGSTAAHHVESLRAQVNDLEAVQKAMHRDLALAIEIGDAMREAMRHGAWGHDGEGHLASVSAGSWDRFKASLAKAPSVPVGASEVPGEGGDSDRRRLEALERFLDGKQSASVAWWQDEFSAVHVSDGVEITAPTLAALADKLAEKEAKP